MGREEYYIKEVNGKKHLFKRGFLFDDDLGELHKTPFWDNEYEFETRNIFRGNFKIGRKGILSKERKFCKLDKGEKGKLKPPGIIESLFDKDHWDYEPDEE